MGRRAPFVPVADPGMGDIKAPRGSAEWAKAMRMLLLKEMHDLAHFADGIGDGLDSLVDTGAWKHLNRRDGENHSDIRDICTMPEPYGLGLSEDKARALLTLMFRGKKFGAAIAPDIHPTRPLAVASVRADVGVQPREEINKSTVDSYREAIDHGASFPPVTVFHDGETYWLADGFHRHAAHLAADRQDILAEVREGGRREALLFAVGANAKHGLPRTNKDKRRAVTLLLGDPECVAMQDTDLARMAWVSSAFVGIVRREMQVAGDIKPFNVRQGSDGKTRDTSKFGRKAKTEEPTPSEEQDDRPAPAQGPTLFEQLRSKLDTAPDVTTLGRAYSEIAHTPCLTSEECESLGEVYRSRSEALRVAPPACPVETPLPAPTPPSPIDVATEMRRHATDNHAPPPVVTPRHEEEEPSALDFGDWLFALADFAKLSTSDQGLMAQSAARLTRDADRQAWAEDVLRRAGERAPAPASGATSVERVLRLIALAGSQSENEARNAAMLACRAIRDGGLVVLAPNDTRLTSTGVMPPFDLDTLQRRVQESVVQGVRDAKVKP